jgi:tRNA G18 (ribose-2'-O)-methylase SpoU
MFLVKKILSSIYYIIKNAFRQVVLLVKFDLLRYFIDMTKIETTDFRVVLVLDRLRSAHNTGNIFRIAEALNAEIAACGYTPFPPHPKLEKTAMGSDKMVKCRHFETSLEAVETLRREGVKMVLAAEPGGSGAWEMEYEFPLAIVLGNEALGVAEETLKVVDGIVSLPMLGEKASINVVNAAAAIMYAVAAKNGIVK